MALFTINYIDADSPSFAQAPNPFTVRQADISQLILDDDDGFLHAITNDPGGTPGIAQNDPNPGGNNGFEIGERVQYWQARSVTGSDGSTGTIYYLANGNATGTQGIAADFTFVDGVTYTVTGAPLSTGIAVPYGDLFCFTAGTLIKTQSGEVLIEDLAKGDMVLTMDHGYQPIRWIGSSKRPATGNMAPILIRKGALGNDRDLRVSPQHRMLLQGWQAELLFGEREVLATAKSLVNDHSIIRVEGGEVEYFHLLFDTHEIIYAEGAPSESFQPGEQGWKALDEPTRNEILELFPELSDGDFSSYGASARFSLKHKEGQLLGQYMLQADEAKLNA